MEYFILSRWLFIFGTEKRIIILLFYLNSYPRLPLISDKDAESYKVEMRALDRWVYSLFDAYGLETAWILFTQEYLSYKVDILLYYFADDCACILAFWAASWSLVFGLQLAQAFE